MVSSGLPVLGPSTRISGSLSVVTPGSIEAHTDSTGRGGTTPPAPPALRFAQYRPRGDDPPGTPRTSLRSGSPRLVRVRAGASGKLRRLPDPPGAGPGSIVKSN